MKTTERTLNMLYQVLVLHEFFLESLHEKVVNADLPEVEHFHASGTHFSGRTQFSNNSTTTQQISTPG